jgi:hypothetical protein
MCATFLPMPSVGNAVYVSVEWEPVVYVSTNIVGLSASKRIPCSMVIGFLASPLEV